MFSFGLTAGEGIFKLESYNHRIAQAGRGLEGSSDPTFCGKESLDEIYLAPCPVASGKPPAMGTLPHAWGGGSSAWLFSL